MGVRVDKSRQHHSCRRIDRFRVVGDICFAISSEGPTATILAIVDQHSAVRDDRKLAQFRARRAAVAVRPA